MAGKFYEATAPIEKLIWSRADAKKAKVCLNFFIQQNINKSIEHILYYIPCVIDHQFDAHQLCVTFKCPIREEHNLGNHSL